MTPLDWLGRKTSTQTNLLLPYFVEILVFNANSVDPVFDANRIDPDQMPQNLVSDLGPLCKCSFNGMAGMLGINGLKSHFGLTHCSRETRKRVIGKQCTPRSDATERGV